MARRKKLNRCQVSGCVELVRRGGRKWCATHYARMHRPKKACNVCLKTFAADLLVGRRCRPCMSTAAHAKRIVDLYGITEDEYVQLLQYQGGRCYICQRKPGKQRLAVDHRHSDGVIRGLLCKADNRGVLGHLHDQVEALERAIEYLNDPPAVRLFGERIAPC